MELNLHRRAFLRWSAAIAGVSVLRRARAVQRAVTLNAHVVIVGGGFAGATCAMSLRRLNPTIRVTVVDPDDPFVTCPMSNSVLVGLRNIQSIRVPRHGLESAGVNYVRDSVSSIDTQSRRASLARGAALEYDRLVMAPGIRFLWGQPQGYDQAAAALMPHAWQAGEQTEILASQLRAMRSGGVVAISVPAGPMRCPPGPYERAGLIAGFLQQHKPRSKVLIFDSNNHFPRQDVFTDAWQSLYPGMIEWISVVDGGAVVRVAAAEGVLYTSQGAHRIDVANIIPPQAPGLLAAQTGLASDHGWCSVRPETFESTAVPDVHVIGDACIAEPMPKAASAANSQAKQCARAIVAILEGREPPNPIFESVCYSMLARGRALSIHGRFELSDGVIRQTPAPAHVEPAQPRQEALNAERWYRQIVTEAFGT
jgi:sulfide dehydrogenase [flavocytochrome c] flavoprotein subunit